MNRILIVLIIVCSPFMAKSQNECGEGNSSMQFVLQKALSNGLKDSVLLEQPLIVIDGISIPFKKRKEAVLNLCSEDVEFIGVISYKTAQEQFDDAKDGVISFHLKKKSGKAWKKYWKTKSD